HGRFVFGAGKKMKRQFASKKSLMKKLSKNFRATMKAIALGGALVAATSLPAADKALRVNLGTLAPRGSVYHQSLQAMAEAWRLAPGGGVRLVVYPDGTQGGEADMVRLMNVETLQAGLLTSVGLS